MTKLGLSDMFISLIKQYDSKMVTNFDETLVKLLYRCLIAWHSINQCQKIFSMNSKKDKLL